MENLSDKKSRLSPAKRALLEQRLRGVSNTNEVTGILPRPRDAVVPLSFAQQRLWFLDQLHPGNSFYNVSRHVRINGVLDWHALSRAFNAVVERHESLRTVFRLDGDEPVQIIQPHQDLPLPLIDLSALTEDERARQIQRMALEHSEIQFRLTDGPLLSASLVRLSSEAHLLFITLHHIITDAWSTSLLLRELLTLYEAFKINKPSPLQELPIQYADFAIWQREFLQGETLEKQLAYWKQQLAGTPSLLELPFDRPRPSVQTFRGAYESFTLSSELSVALKDLATQDGATLYIALLTAFQILLWRHARQDKIVVGTPIANRTRKEIESLVGFFVNTLVMSTTIRGDMTFRELLRLVKETTLEAYSHQDLPFEKLVEELQPERSLSHNPLFQVTLSFQNVPQAVGKENFIIDPTGFGGRSTRLDLEAYFWDLPEGLGGEFVYSTDLFDRRTIQGLLQRFQILLEGIVSKPDCRISELPLLTATERHELLVAWNDTQRVFPAQHCIHELFEAQAEKTPNAIALVCANEQLTYHELNSRSNQLAHYLQRFGIGPEDRVGVCLRRTPAMLIAILGTLKAGACYMPLDPAYPRERSGFALRDAGVAVLLTQNDLLPMLPQTDAQVVCVDSDCQIIALEDQSNPISTVTPQNLGYVIYTSGSTGQPKGVAIEQASTVAFLHWAASYFDAQDLAAILASTSICFDLSVFEIFAPLCSGGKVMLVEDALHLSDLASADVSLLNTVPSAMAELVRLRSIPASVKTINLAGEPLTNRLVQEIYQQDSVQHVLNLYGPSEDTTYSTFARVAKGSTEEPSIGRPIANTEVYLLDRFFHPVPVGVPAELHLGGAGLARGYLNQASLTAERFVPNPFSRSPGARLYKTGDLARYQPDGSIQFLGRLDRQVKLRGYRIELGEIETALREQASVQDAVVVLRTFEQNNKDLVAYIVANPGEVGAELRERLQGSLKRKLPAYMTPAYFVFLERLPLSPNGKIDQLALPPPEKSRADLVDVLVAPRTPTEIKLASLWRDVLGREEIGIYDNFFDLGGHSLLATQVMARIRETFGVNMPLRYFFEQPTVAGLAEFLKKASSPDHKLVPKIRRLPRD